MRISDWSSDVCSSDLPVARRGRRSPGRRCEGGGVQCWRRCLRLGAFDRARLMEKDGILMPDGDALTPSRYARSRAYRWYAVGVLMLIYMCHAVDRSMPSILTEPIRAEFNLSYAQLGLFTGVAYGISIAIFVLPMGYFNARVNRRNY